MAEWEERGRYEAGGFDAYRTVAHTQSASDATASLCTGLATCARAS